MEWMVVGVVAAGLTVVGGVVGASAMRLKKRIQGPASNCPAAYLQRPHEKAEIRLICIGDSLTHGTVSANYCDLIQQDLDRRLGNRKVDVINAGIGGQCVCSMLERLEEISQCCPTHVVVLAGTNDVKGSYNPVWGERSAIEWPSMSAPPTMLSFKENYHKLVQALLRLSPNAKVALTTVPMLGEDLTSTANSFVQEANAFIQEQSNAAHAFTLPLYDQLADLLRISETSQSEALQPRESVDAYQANMIKCIIKFYVFRRSWKQAGASYGFRVLSDGVHLNEDGARIMANLVSNWIEAEIPQGNVWVCGAHQ